MVDFSICFRPSGYTETRGQLHSPYSCPLKKASVPVTKVSYFDLYLLQVCKCVRNNKVANGIKYSS
jgi:hypothetical protein